MKKKIAEPCREFFRATIVIPLMISLAGTVCNAEPVADGAVKFLGNITSRWYTPESVHFLDLWNQVTPENEGKWGVVERNRNSMDWQGLDSSYQFAKRNHLPFKQHTFVWGNQEPSWIGSLSKEDQLKEVLEWMDLYAQRYPDVDLIDVVNEPISHPVSYREALGGMGETGYDWVIRAFEEARKRFPKAKLLINEYHVIDNDGLTEQMGYITTVLKLRNLIDGIGLQSHYFSYPTTTPETVKKNIDRLAATGVPVYCTEFDATGNDSVQLSVYQTYFPILWEHPSVYGVTLWGWIQGTTWENNTWLVDRSGNERPAFTWLKKYVSEHKDVTLATSNKIQQTVTPATNPICTQVRLYRNSVAITFPHPGIYSWTITDLSGEVVARSSARVHSSFESSFRLPRPLSPGAYLFRTTGPKGIFSSKRVMLR